MKLPGYVGRLWDKWKTKTDGKPMSAKEKWMLLFLSGLLLAVIILPGGGKKENALSSFGDTNPGNSVQKEANSEPGKVDASAIGLNQYEVYLSGQLKEILSQIEGAGAVETWVTLSGSSEMVLYEEKDSESTRLQEADSVGGSRVEDMEHTDRSVLKDSAGNPYVIKTLQPQVEGVLVVAEGAGDSLVKKNISEAVQVLFGIDAHRIKVAKKKLEE